MYRYRDTAANVEITELAMFLDGFAAGLKLINQADLAIKIATAADWLDKLAPYVCGQGIVGCQCGPKCGSDHK